MESATEQPAKAKPETIGIFWKTCVCLAAKGASPFANDWQWFFGYPVYTYITGTTLFAAIVGNRTGMITGHPGWDTLIAGIAAFVLTWLVAFIGRVVTVAATKFNEAEAKSAALGAALSDAELRTAHTKAIEDQTKALREQIAATGATSKAAEGSRIRLTKTQCADLARELSGRGLASIDPDDLLLRFAIGNQECKTFAQDLKSAFGTAGWNGSFSTTLDEHHDLSGLRLCVESLDAKPKAAIIMAESLREAKIPFDWWAWTGIGASRVVVFVYPP